MSEDNQFNFNEARAIRHNDARLWTPLDCLKALVRELENGEKDPVDAIYIAMVRKGETGNAKSFPFYAAGATGLELRGLLAQHLHDVCAAFNNQ